MRKLLSDDTQIKTETLCSNALSNNLAQKLAQITFSCIKVSVR